MSKYNKFEYSDRSSLFGKAKVDNHSKYNLSNKLSSAECKTGRRILLFYTIS